MFIILCILFILSVISCSNTTNKVDSKTSEEDEKIKNTLFAKADEITSAASGVNIYVGEDGKKTITVILGSAIDYLRIGDYINEICTYAAGETFATDIGSFVVEVRDKNLKPALQFITSTFTSGSFIDLRSGKPKLTKIYSFDDLKKIFPAMNITEKENEVSDHDMQIYNEVISALDEEPTRPEKEIFANIAPKYNMTADQLKKLIDDIMEKIYS